MSNRGRHKKKKQSNGVLKNSIYSEIENFFKNKGLMAVVVYYSKDGIHYDDEERFYRMPTHTDLAISMLEAINKGYNFIRVPNSNLIEDKYYRI